MKYVSFILPSGEETWGVSREEVIYDLGPTGLNLAPSLKSAIERKVFGHVSEKDLAKAECHSEHDVDFLPCVPNPRKIICVGVNYRTHQEESGKTGQTSPTIFVRFPDTQIGHKQPALKPTVTNQFDYEGELALVIGKEAWRIPPEEAYDYVAGYAIYNDFSVRDWQKAASQWIPGKNFPGTGAFGPYLVPSSDIGDVNSLILETRVNGKVRQNASVGDLEFDIPTLLNYITTFTQLSPGDIIVTGTPGGVGLFWGEDGLLQAGDEVEVAITNLGTLRNTVVGGTGDLPEKVTRLTASS